MESSQYNHPSHQHHQYQQQQRTLSPSHSRDMYMASNTVPVYRHGRKFYVSAEEFERMRADERRNRRTAMQKSQNLPISKSYSISYRPPSTSLYNPIHRSTSNPNETRYAVLRTPHLPLNSITNNNFNRQEPTRQSRSTFRYYDERDEVSSIGSALPIKLLTTAIRSNSSDKVLDLRRTPQPSISSYSGYVPDDYEIKRSVSAEVVQPQSSPQTQPQVQPRRTIPTTTSDYGMSTVSAFPTTTTDQTYNQSNASKLTSYFTRVQPSSLNPPIKPSASTYTGKNSTYEPDMQDSDHIYSVVTSSNRRTGGGLTSVLSRSPTHNSNSEYHYRDTISGSLSDDNSSSPSMLNQQRNNDNNRYRRAQLVVETDDDYGRQNEVWTRSTARSHSSDGLTEKKRVRFADMEGFTLETAPRVEQQRSPMNSRLLTKRSHVQPSNNFQAQLEPFHNSFYQTTARVGGSSGSKLATDV